MKKLTALFLATALVLALFTACGGSSQSVAAPAMKGDYAMVEEAAAEAPAAMQMNTSMADTGSGETGSAALPENRKWIITVDMNAETEDLDALMQQLEAQIAALGGYVEDQSIHNGSAYSSYRRRSANLTVRIPAQDVDSFTQEVSGIANVVSQNLRREDITLTYVATESKVTALKTEEARLLELLAQAETMSDLLEIEARLSDVRYELENYTSRLRLYDNQVDYATIYLYIDEVQEYTPAPERTPLQRIRDGFVSSVKGLGEGIVDAVVWVLSNSPYLVVWGILLGGGLALLLKLRRRAKARKAAPKNNET